MMQHSLVKEFSFRDENFVPLFLKQFYELVVMPRPQGK